MSIVRILSYWLLAVGLFFGQMESGHALFNNSKFFHSSKELENDDEKTPSDEKKVTPKNETIGKNNIFDNEQDEYVVITKKPLEEDEETASANFQKQIMDDYVGTLSIENQNFIGNDREEEGLEPEKLESQKKQETITTNSSFQLDWKVFANKNEKNINEENILLSNNLQENEIKEKSKHLGDDGVLKAYEVFNHKEKTIDFNEWKKFVLQNKSNQKACQEATNRMAECITWGYLISNFVPKDILVFKFLAEPTLSRFLQPFAKLPLRLNCHRFKASDIKGLAKHLPNLHSLLLTEPNFAHAHFGDQLDYYGSMILTLGLVGDLPPPFTKNYHYSDMDSVVKTVATYCPHLKQLGLRYSITADILEAICVKELKEPLSEHTSIMLDSPIKKSATEMELPYRMISDKTMQLIALGFKDLRKLELPYRALSETGIGDLSKLKNLKVLNLNNVLLLQGSNSGRAVKLIAGQCKNLTELHIAGWGFKDKDSIVQYVQENSPNLKLIEEERDKVKNNLGVLQIEKMIKDELEKRNTQIEIDRKNKSRIVYH